MDNYKRMHDLKILKDLREILYKLNQNSHTGWIDEYEDRSQYCWAILDGVLFQESECFISNNEIYLKTVTENIKIEKDFLEYCAHIVLTKVPGLNDASPNGETRVKDSRGIGHLEDIENLLRLIICNRKYMQFNKYYDYDQLEI